MSGNSGPKCDEAIPQGLHSYTNNGDSRSLLADVERVWFPIFELQSGVSYRLPQSTSPKILPLAPMFTQVNATIYAFGYSYPPFRTQSPSQVRKKGTAGYLDASSCGGDPQHRQTTEQFRFEPLSEPG